jgi:hypothetical protein
MTNHNLPSEIAKHLINCGVKIIELPGGCVQLLGKYGSIMSPTTSRRCNRSASTNFAVLPEKLELTPRDLYSNWEESPCGSFLSVPLGGR